MICIKTSPTQKQTTRTTRVKHQQNNNGATGSKLHESVAGNPAGYEAYAIQASLIVVLKTSMPQRATFDSAGHRNTTFWLRLRRASQRFQRQIKRVLSIERLRWHVHRCIPMHAYDTHTQTRHTLCKSSRSAASTQRHHSR